MTNWTVTELWRYPVKSMIGQTVDHVQLDQRGIVGDRTWAVRDEVRGGIRGAKQLGGLMRCAARYVDDTERTVEITLSDGSTVRTDSPDVSERVSAVLDHPVTLWPLRPADDLDHYRRGAPTHDDMMTELNAIFGREAGEPLPDFSVFPPEVLEFESPPGTYYDAYPLLVLTTSALRSLQQAVPDAVVDVRRFRPSIVIDTGDLPGHPELGWAGGTMRIGEVELRLVTPCPRCVMTTREIDADVPQDRSILRHIVRDLGQNLGIYAAVSTAGRISTGDPVSVTSSTSS